MFQESPKLAAFHSAIGCDLYNGNGRRGDVVTWLLYIYLLRETRNSHLENLTVLATPLGAEGRGPGFPLSLIGNIKKNRSKRTSQPPIAYTWQLESECPGNLQQIWVSEGGDGSFSTLIRLAS